MHNALKFTSNGQIRISVSYDSAREKLLTCVADSGKGIKPSEKKNLFKMFGKLNRTASQNSAGLGMGLMVCKQSIE